MRFRAVCGAIRLGAPAVATRAANSSRSMLGSKPNRYPLGRTRPTRATAAAQARAVQTPGAEGSGPGEAHSVTPTSRNARAVTGFIAAEPGTRLVSQATSHRQPAKAPRPMTMTAPPATRGIRAVFKGFEEE